MMGCPAAECQVRRHQATARKHMKVVKILFGVLAALWGLALIPKLLSGIFHSDAPFAFSRMMGSVAGILIASAISIGLFRSAFKK